MIKTLGELLLENGKPLLKMWNVSVDEGKRQYVHHQHTRFELTVVESGHGEYTTQKATYPMNPGDVFVFSSNEVHSITRVFEGGLSLTNLHFEPRYLNSTNSEEHIENYINFCFFHSSDFENRIPAEKATNILENFQKIKTELKNNDIEYPVAVKAHLNLILIDLLRNHNYSSTAVLEKTDSIFNIMNVYDYIDEHLCEEITLNDLASIAGLSPNYFSHLFKKNNGISLWDYITAKRIEKAINILQHNRELTILEIALECGFNNTTNFNKAFKKQKCLTPSEYRKNPTLLYH